MHKRTVREEIPISHLILDGETIKTKTGFIYKEPEYIDVSGKRDFAEEFQLHTDWGIEVEETEDLHVELNGSLMDIEAFSVKGERYSGCGVFDSLERENGELTRFSIQGHGRLKEYETV